MVWEVIASQVLGAGLGAYGANQAASAQEDGAKRAAEASNRGSLAQLQLLEPQRFMGYQALGDLGTLYGYQQAPYTSIQDVQQTLNKVGAKQIKQGLKNGMSLQDLAQMGSLGDINGKQMKQLIKQGLSAQDIIALQNGSLVKSQAPAAAAPPTAAAAPAASGGAGNMSRFFTSPDYQFRQQQGAAAIDRSAAARGGALSGNAVRAGTEYASNLASGEYNNYVSRLMQMAGLGSAATTQAGGAIGQNANTQANAQMAQGDARASGIMGGVNSAVNAINNGMSLYTLQQYMNQPAAAPPTGYRPAPGMGIMPLSP